MEKDPARGEGRTRERCTDLRGRVFSRFVLYTLDLGRFVRIRSALVFLAAVLSAACGDTTGFTEWDPSPDSITLYSASRPELLGQPSAFNVSDLNVLRVEQPGAAGNWDFALTGTNQLQLTPASAFAGQPSKAALVPITGKTLDQVTEAPSDTSLYSSQSQPIAAGNVFIVRTRKVACSYSTAVHYGKLQVVSVDPVQGIAKLAVVRNPYCDDRSFDPKK
jgi:hypothetical protein